MYRSLRGQIPSTMSLRLLGLIELLVALLVESQQGWIEGYASCYGDYKDRVDENSVACGYGSFIAGEDFTYTTAICSTWVHSVCGSCYEVMCDGGMTPNMGCQSNAVTHVRVIDSLGTPCSSGRDNHVFDLSTVPFGEVATENGSPAQCSGHIYVKYRPVSCSSVGIVRGGLKIGIQPNQQDPYCPPFWFTNVGGAGALYGVQVSSDGGNTWHTYKRNSGNGGRWDCKDNSGGGSYLGKALSFKLELCAQADLPESCTASAISMTFLDALPSNWCANGASPCTSDSWELPQNFGDEVSQPPIPSPSPTPDPAAPCKIWCGRNTKPWSDKCTWADCNGCPSCAQIEPPTTPDVPCKPWCGQNTKPWTKKCTWPDCSGCASCAGTEPPTTPDCSSLWGQCGGSDWNGPTCCTDSVCIKESDWYSQCKHPPRRNLKAVLV